MSAHDGIAGEFPPVVLVWWSDSFMASEGWTARDESIESGKSMVTDPIYAAGFLIHQDDDGIVIASAWNHHSDDVSGAMAIPRSAIVRMDRLHDGYEGS